MSPTILLLLALLGAALFVTLTWLVIQSRRKDEKSSAESIQAAFQTLTAELVQKQMDGMLALRNSLDQANKILNDRLTESSRSLDKRVEVFGEIKSQIGELAVQAKNIESIGQNIQSLSELLKPPKLRGNVGETFLENMLSQILPKALYELQHSFPSGQRVDAVIKFGDRLFSIDSKFPLEAFNKHIENPESNEYRKQFTQSIKKHVDDICARYIIPQEGTLEFAIMYIPAEAIYYQLISNESELFSYALSKKVIPSSPGHLYGYLATMSAVYRETGLMNQGRQLTAFINNLADSLQKLSGLHERMDGSVRALTLSLSKARDETRSAEQHLGRIQRPDEEQPQIARQIDYLIDNSNPN